MTIVGDNPIQSVGDDVLGRAEAAGYFSQQVLALDCSKGLVVGVLGPWGSGKTSFVNLARQELESSDVPILDFNPWMFSGAEQLLESFFIELSSQLKMRPGLAEVGKNLEAYGEAFAGLGWLPMVGPWIERGRAAASVVGKMLKNRKEGAGGRREKLEQILSELEKPIAVVLDDIDRLNTSEIRDIFKLVRLTACFPNIIYIVAFDRDRVEQALNEQSVPGRDYLEKIIQVAVDLPTVPESVLRHQVADSINTAVSDIENTGPFDQEAWPDIFVEVVLPLVRHMRDVRRYSASVHGTVLALKGQVALQDVLGLEAVRIFLPDTFKLLHRSIDSLTSTSRMDLEYGQDLLQEKVNALIEAGGDKGSIVRNMISRLFPAGSRYVGGSHYGADWQSGWLRERKVAHESILQLYLERVVSSGLHAFNEAELAWSKLHDASELDECLRAIESERLRDVISGLEAYEDIYEPCHVVSGCTVLLNLLPDIPVVPRSMYDLENSTIVSRVVLRLLRSLGNPDAIEAAAREIYPQVTTLSVKLELLDDLGHRPNAGHQLISEQSAAALEGDWRDEVRATNEADLLRESDLLKVLVTVLRDASPAEDALTVGDSPELTLVLLRSSRSESTSQTMGNRAITRTPRLAWAALVELLGDEEAIDFRLGQFGQLDSQEDSDLVDLARRYLEGWRPDDD